MKAKKRHIKELLCYLYVDELIDGPIERVIQRIQEIKKKYSNKGYENIVFDYTYDYHTGTTEVDVYGERLETDEELKKRIAKNERERKRKRERRKAEKEKKQKEELKLLKKLIKKYGKK